MNPLISVVVPVYNVEQYLEQCVESIRNQTYINLEIILVDDGSPDKCPEICDQFADKDTRIKVIHKENGGLSDARNVGVEFAHGEYVVFIDSDDWIHKDMIMEMLHVLHSDNAIDIVVCASQRVDKTPKPINEKKIQKFRICDKEDIVEKWLYQKIKTSACAILLPYNLCKKINFPKGRLYEDLFTTYKFYWNSKKIGYILSPLYYYRRNASGIMKQKFSLKKFDEIDAVNEIIDFFKKESPFFLSAAYSRKFSACAQVLRCMPQSLTDRNLIIKQNELWEFLLENRRNMIFNTKARMKNRIGACCTFLGIKFFRNIFANY